MDRGRDSARKPRFHPDFYLTIKVFLRLARHKLMFVKSIQFWLIKLRIWMHASFVVKLIGMLFIYLASITQHVLNVAKI